jgi:hypothetical protein
MPAHATTAQQGLLEQIFEPFDDEKIARVAADLWAPSRAAESPVAGPAPAGDASLGAMVDALAATPVRPIPAPIPMPPLGPEPIGPELDQMVDELRQLRAT